MFSFKNLSIILSILGFTLFITHLFAPEPVFSLFQISENESSFFNARRTSILYLGISVLSFLGRNELHSNLRQKVCIVISVIMFGLAFLGIYEYLIGVAGIGIGIAVLTEIFIGAGFIRIWFNNRNN